MATSLKICSDLIRVGGMVSTTYVSLGMEGRGWHRSYNIFLKKVKKLFCNFVFIFWIFNFFLLLGVRIYIPSENILSKKLSVYE